MGEVLELYRIAKTFPPGAEEYRTFRQKLESRGRRVGGGQSVQRAASGLTCFTTFQGALKQQEDFPALGSMIVQYRIPDTLSHLVDQILPEPGHVTFVARNPLDLHIYLKSKW